MSNSKSSPPVYSLGDFFNALRSIEVQRRRLKESSPSDGVVNRAIMRGTVEEAEYFVRLQYQQVLTEETTRAFSQLGVAQLELVVDGEWGEELSSKHLRLLRARYCKQASVEIAAADALALTAFAEWGSNSSAEIGQPETFPAELSRSMEKFRADYPNPKVPVYRDENWYGFVH